MILDLFKGLLLGLVIGAFVGLILTLSVAAVCVVYFALRYA